MAVIRKIKIMPCVEPAHSMWRRVWTHVMTFPSGSTWHNMHDWLQETYDCRVVTTYDNGNKGINLIFDSAEGHTAFQLTWCCDHD
jgi:Zn/Cd-binding protein ZinT